MNGEKAIFFWLPESKVVGPRVYDLQPDNQLKHHAKRYNRKRPLLPGEGLMTQTDTDIDTRLDINMPKRKAAPPKGATLEVWQVATCDAIVFPTNLIATPLSTPAHSHYPVV